MGQELIGYALDYTLRMVNNRHRHSGLAGLQLHPRREQRICSEQSVSGDSLNWE